MKTKTKMTLIWILMTILIGGPIILAYILETRKKSNFNGEMRLLKALNQKYDIKSTMSKHPGDYEFYPCSEIKVMPECQLTAGCTVNNGRCVNTSSMLQKPAYYSFSPNVHDTYPMLKLTPDM